MGTLNSSYRIMSSPHVLVLVALVAIVSAAAASTPQFFSVTCSDTFVCTIRSGIHHTSASAWGFFADEIDETGWARLEVTTNEAVRDDIALFAAGWLEGYLCGARIGQSYLNYMASTFNNAPKPALMDFMWANFNWTYAQVESIEYSFQIPEFAWQYWAQVGLVLQQIDGIADGYTTWYKENPTLSQGLPALSNFEIYLLNSDGDMDDLVPAMNRASDPSHSRSHGVDLSPERLRQLLLGSHCSSITTFTSSQLYAAHEMWSTFSQMLMVYKVYNFKTSLDSLVSEVVVMSSYPAYVSSEDDFYLMSSGLQVMETTNSVLNLSLYDAVAPASLLSWVRAMVANRMAHNGSEWTQIMTDYNSGTYNNQWIVVDHNKFKPGRPIEAGTLWIAEQIPGLVMSGDVSSVLQSQGYWPSYNVPYFTEIFNAMGYPQAVSTMGNVWSYAANPRANIMRAYHANISDDVSTIQDFMRYNNWQNDPLQLGCSTFGLAARADLAPAQQKPIWGGLCGPAAFGAINGKISSSQLIKHFGAYIVAGPTTNGQPPFTWNSQWGVNNAHVGQPDTFDFDWQEMAGIDVVG